MTTTSSQGGAPTITDANVLHARPEDDDRQDTAGLHRGGHRCPAQRCGTDIPTEQFMCSVHWPLVSPPLREAITASSPKHGSDDAPAPQYTALAQAAIDAVAHHADVKDHRIVGPHRQCAHVLGHRSRSACSRSR